MEASGHARWFERLLGELQFWMWRQGWDYQQWTSSVPHAGQPGNRDGVPSNTE
jgi:hypothetical protein